MPSGGNRTPANPAPSSGPGALSQLTAGTQRPDEPITSGADAGPGPGSASLGLPPLEQQGGSTGRSTVQTFAQRPDASPQLKQLAANLGG